MLRAHAGETAHCKFPVTNAAQRELGRRTSQASSPSRLGTKAWNLTFPSG